MIEDFTQLSELQLDALREIGNVGAGNAAAALSQLLNRKIDMAVTKISLLPFSEVNEVIGGAERVVAGVCLRVEGSAPGNILYLIPAESAGILVDMLMGRSVDSPSVAEDMAQSALLEIGNILAGAYLNALSMFTSLTFIPSVPALAQDMAGAILSEILFKLGQVGDYALVIETEFVENERQVDGHIFLLPEPGSLDLIMEALGMKG